MKDQIKTYEFTLLLDRAREVNEELENEIFELGFDDALLYSQGGVVCLDVSREATSFYEAVVSALKQIEKSNLGLKVAAVEPGDLVTASEIARRLSVSREYVRLLISGKRGKGIFPSPISRIGVKNYIWSWSEVVRFMKSNMPENKAVHQNKAQFFKELNTQLQEEKVDYKRLKKYK
jgi:hypothetical protein